MKIKLRLGFGIALLLCSQTAIVNAQSFTYYNQEVKNESITLDMIAVSGGSFNMGSKTREADEKPIHEVILDDFWMGKHEITWEQYDAFVFGEFGPQQFPVLVC